MEGWVEWFVTNGASGEEPLEDVKRCIELYRQVVVSTDTDEQVELMKQILAINAEHLYALGITAGAPFSAIVVKNNVRNVPEEMWQGWLWPDPGPSNPCQYYFEQA
jgi:peptide/nickel transport system substrate-binding protein